jgi:hypothetical protein
MKISRKKLRLIIREELGGGGRPSMNRRNSTSWRAWVGGKVSEADDVDDIEVGDDERSAEGGPESITSESKDLDKLAKIILHLA